MNNGVLIGPAKLPQGGAWQLVRRSLVRRPDPDPDALKSTVYRCAVSFVGACSQAMWGRLQAGSYRCSPKNPMCALLLFVVLAVCSSLHAQSTGIYVNNNNNVGIGTTNPNQQLSVANSLAVTNYAGIQYILMGNQDSGGVNDPAVIQSANGSFYFGHGSSWSGQGGTITQNVTFTQGGNVGIGTTNPGANLDVYGIFAQRNAPADVIRIAAQTSVPNGTGGVDNGFGPGLLFFGSITGGGTRNLGRINTVNDANNASALAFWTQTSADSITEKMRISSSGNVGIGTTNPNINKLLVFGAVGTDDYTYTAQHHMQLRIMNGLGANGSRAMELGVLDGGTSIIQSNELGVGYNALALNPVAGNVGIGTISPQYKLDVAGQVHATSFVASSGNNYADFVFKPGYKLEPLSAVEASIQKDGHLPGIPSEAEAKAHGIDLASMQVKLLQKIEELTLHVISQEKRIEKLENENAALREKATK